MNEKFKQLALQAKMGTADFDAGSYYVAGPDKMQQFAELIVNECADLFPNVYVSIETDHGHTSVIAANYIKKHFGVEQ
jgi:hypothetical protein